MRLLVTATPSQDAHQATSKPYGSVLQRATQDATSLQLFQAHRQSQEPQFAATGTVPSEQPPTQPFLQEPSHLLVSLLQSVRSAIQAGSLTRALLPHILLGNSLGSHALTVRLMLVRQ